MRVTERALVTGNCLWKISLLLCQNCYFSCPFLGAWSYFGHLIQFPPLVFWHAKSRTFLLRSIFQMFLFPRTEQRLCWPFFRPRAWLKVSPLVVMNSSKCVCGLSFDQSNVTFQHFSSRSGPLQFVYKFQTVSVSIVLLSGLFRMSKAWSPKNTPNLPRWLYFEQTVKILRWIIYAKSCSPHSLTI